MRIDDTDSDVEQDTPSRLDRTGIPTRFTEIDFLKAIGILAVVLIHALRSPWDPTTSSTELWLGVVLRFAVPGFLLCSGFLYATAKPIPFRTVVRRLRRVLIPYLICSIGAQAWWMTNGEGHTFNAIIRELLLGASFGPFYYVFVHFSLVLFSPLFALLPRFAIAGLTVLLILSQGWLESRTSLALPIFWHIRNPLLWWSYFMIGWLIRLHYDEITRWVASRRSALMTIMALTILACTGIANMEDQTEWGRLAMWLDIYAILGFIFVSAIGRNSVSASIRTLSDATFAIYLLHLFFIYAAKLFLQPSPMEFDGLVVAGYCGAGLFGSLAVIAVTRRLLGSRSRDVIGA